VVFVTAVPSSSPTRRTADPPPHGTRRRYNTRDPQLRCRCRDCCDANTRYMAGYRATLRIRAGRFRQLTIREALEDA
jgi:hypothetical protein